MNFYHSSWCEMFHCIFLGALDPHICQFILFAIQGVLDQKLMEGAILSRVLEHWFSLLHDHTHQVVELHQDSSMCHGEDEWGVFFTQILISDYVLIHDEFQELEATAIHISPTLSLLAFVITNALVLLVGHLFPGGQGTALENASTLLPDELGQGSWDFLQVFGLRFNIFEGGDSPAQIRDVDVIEVQGMVLQEDAYFFGLFLAILGETAWLLPADSALDIILGLSMSREEQFQTNYFSLHLIVDMIDRVVQINGQDIIIGQDLTLSHAGTVWDGALTMVYYWAKNPQVAEGLLKGKRVLQLGSGTGIVGIAAATFGPKTVILTDLPEFLTILQTNQQRNLHLSASPNCLQVHRLQWDNPVDLQSIKSIDTIIGSQLAYDKQNVIRLINTVRYYRTINPKLKLMIAYQKYPQEQKNLQIKFGEYFPGEFSLVPWEEFDEDYRDPHIGIISIQ